MIDGYIPFSTARASQVSTLQKAIGLIGDQVLAAGKAGVLSGAGPIFLGMGASLAAAAAPVWTLRSRGIDSWRLNAGEHPLPYPVSEHKVIAVSQSGRSAETLAVIKTIVERRRIAVVNVVPSPITEVVPTTIALNNLEDSYASTIGYTATLAALGMIAEAWGDGTIDPAWTSLEAAMRHVERKLEECGPRIAEPLSNAGSVDFAAAAASAGTAEIGALLLREVARLPATGTSTRQYLHGAMESASRATAHVLIGDDREAAVARTLARAGCRTILVTQIAASDEENLSALTIPTMAPARRAILEALVVQGLAVAAATARGVDPDAFVFHHDDTKVA